MRQLFNLPPSPHTNETSTKIEPRDEAWMHPLLDSGADKLLRDCSYSREELIILGGGDYESGLARVNEAMLQPFREDDPRPFHNELGDR